MIDITNTAGATIFANIKKHAMLHIPTVATTDQKGKEYHVLSVGMHRSGKALVTVKENGKPIAYQLPKGKLEEWAIHSIRMARQGYNAFPTEIEFGQLPTGYYAEII